MSTSAHPGLEKIRSAMSRTNDLFNTEVFGKRNVDALEQIYTHDARVLPPGAPMLSGLDSIKQFWSQMIQATKAKSAVLQSLDVMPAGDGAVEIGNATITVEPGSEMAVKYVVYWKQENEQWKWHVDIWNTNA